MQPLSRQVDQDGERVAELLPLGERIGAVLDRDRHLDIAKPALRDLPQELRCMRNPVLARVNQVAALSSIRRARGKSIAPPRKRLPRAKSAPCLVKASISPAISSARC